MCHSWKNNRKINRLYERCLKIIYNVKQSSFIKLPEKVNSVSIHQRNLQTLAIEMLKVSHGLSPVLMNDIFKLLGEQTYNLRKLSQFYRPKLHIQCHRKCVIFRTNNMELGTKWAKRYRKPSSIQKRNQKVVTREMSL